MQNANGQFYLQHNNLDGLTYLATDGEIQVTMTLVCWLNSRMCRDLVIVAGCWR